MNQEEKIVIAFLFKRSGKNKLKDSELYLPLSLELGWFSTKDARQFIEYVIKQSLLLEKEGFLIPNFDIEKISIPIGFTPSKSGYSINSVKEKEDVFHKITQLIIKKTNNSYGEVEKNIKKIQTEKKITSEVAALLVAKELDIEIDKKTLDLIEKSIFKENE